MCFGSMASFLCLQLGLTSIVFLLFGKFALATDHYASPPAGKISYDVGTQPPTRLTTLETNVDGDPTHRRVHFITISDQDSRVRNANGLRWSSSARGTIDYQWDKHNKVSKFNVIMNEKTHEYSSRYEFNQRGSEFSELQVFNGRLITVCDRTGMVYWVHGDLLVPWVSFTDGNGVSEKPFKTEWMTIYKGELVCGGTGREWTDAKQGKLLKSATTNHPLYVKIVDDKGAVRHDSWAKQFGALREKVFGFNDVERAYLEHEAVRWSDVLHRWVFLPKTLSNEPYDFRQNTSRGANVILTADKDFTDVKMIQIRSSGEPDRTRGFSTFHFIPDTGDEVVVAIKTTEQKVVGQDGQKKYTNTSYITVINIKDGEVYVPETKISDTNMYEGLEFIDWTKKYWNAEHSTSIYKAPLPMTVNGNPASP